MSSVILSRGRAKLRRTVRRITAPGQHRVVVVSYHNIGSPVNDPWSLSVSPENLAEHLAVLCASGKVISLRELAESIRRRALPHRAIVLTFDDGYASSLEVAKPLLERFNLPATVFVTTGVDANREFWWDDLERLVLLEEALPEHLRLVIEGNEFLWDLSQPRAPRVPDLHRQWHATRSPVATARQELYRVLYRTLRALTESARQNALDQIRSWAGTTARPRPTHRAMTRAEIKELATSPLVDIGAHSVTHPVMANLAQGSQRAEVRESKKALEEWLNRPITAFAYPYGGPNDYSSETKSIIAREGFSCACAAFDGFVTRNSDRFALPRCGVENWTGKRFAKQVSDWIRG